MRWIHKIPVFIEKECVGCKTCAAVCKFDAIKFVDNKAQRDEDKCWSCMKCKMNCPYLAIADRFLDEPKYIVFDYSDVDPAAINELCAKAHMDPERAMCMCTMTPAKEGAAAVIKGARTMKELAIMTGIKTDCGIYCSAPMERLLKAHLGPDYEPPNNLLWGYAMEPILHKVSKEVADKYPEYYIKEDQEHDKKLELPTIMELF